VTTSTSYRWILWVVLLFIAFLACTCWGSIKALRYSIDKPPVISAEYRSGEAFLVMEDLAGEIIAEIAEETGSSPITRRSWETSPCTSGWDGRILWDGYVSVGVAYKFPRATEDDVTSVDYGEIAELLESLGMDPEVDGEDRKIVRAERDDGLRVDFYPGSHLSIHTNCVVEGGPYIYTPPHGNVSPADDHIGVDIQ
jgi:hypothetical protein